MQDFHANFIAGIMAGAVTTLMVHPLDLIKVRLQVDASSANMQTRLRNAVFAGFEQDYLQNKKHGDSVPKIGNTSSSIPKNSSTSAIKEGANETVASATKAQVVKSLYRGLPVNLIGNTISWGMYFSLYHHFKNILIDNNGHMKLQANDANSTSSLNTSSNKNSTSESVWKFTETADQSTLYLICALASGTLTSLLTNPIWVLKTRYLSTTTNTTHKPLNTTHPSTTLSKTTTPNSSQINVRLTDIIKNEGIKSLWRGFLPGLFGVAQGSLQFAVYDQVKTHRLNIKSKKMAALNKKNGVSDTHGSDGKAGKLDQWEYIVLSATSKIIATVALYPYQVVRSRLQMSGGNQKSLTNPSSSSTTSASSALSSVSKEQTRKTYKNAREVIAHTIKYEGGVRALYKGLFPNLLRVVPSTTITFVVYENVQHWLKN